MSKDNIWLKIPKTNEESIEKFNMKNKDRVSEYEDWKDEINRKIDLLFKKMVLFNEKILSLEKKMNYKKRKQRK